jgi:tetratricopeptide (TPR) repeat protein
MGVELVQTDIVIKHTGYHDSATILEKSVRNLRIILDELKREPDNLLLQFNAARTLAGIGRGEEAVAYMKKIMEQPSVKEKHPHFFLETGMLMGKYYLEMGLPDEAVSVFRELSQEFEQEGLVHFYLGKSLLQRGEYRDAIDELQIALRFPVTVGVSPVRPDAIRFQQYYFLGLAYQQTGELERAREMFLKSLGLHPDHYKSLERLGILGLKNCNYQEAVKYFEKTIHEGGTFDTNYSNLGLAYHKMGEIQKSQEAFLKALDINPDHIETLTNLGHLSLEIKNYDMALRFFAKAKRLAPDLIDVQLALSIIYFHFKEIELMVGECDTLLQELSLPRDIIVNCFEDLARLYQEIGDRLTEYGRLQAALMAYRVSLQLFPLPEILTKMVALASRLGNIEKIVQEIREILATHSGHSDVIEMIVKALGETQKHCC